MKSQYGSVLKKLLLIIFLPVFTSCGGGSGGSDGGSGQSPTPTPTPAVISSATSFSFDENSAFSFRIDAVDPNDDSLRLDILDTVDGRFFSKNLYADTSILEIKTDKLFDYENPDDVDGDSVYELDVRLTGSSSVTQRFSITITDSPGDTYYEEVGAGMILGIAHDRIGDDFGYPAQSIGDIDGDGINEVLLSAPDWREEREFGELTYTVIEGLNFLVSGEKLLNAEDGALQLMPEGSDGIVRLDWTAQTEADLPFVGEIGNYISDLGDLDGDQIPEIAISSPHSQGHIFIIRGDVLRNAMTDTHYVSLATLIDEGKGARIYGENDRRINIGLNMSPIEDIDGDGMNELVICNVYGDSSHPMSYILFGETITPLLGGTALNLAQYIEDNEPHVALYGETCHSISNAGDFDGDDISDIVISERFPLAEDTSRLSVVFGSAILDAYLGSRTIDLDDVETGNLGLSIIAHDVLSNNNFEYVSSAGDFNGDGFDDVIVGIPDKLYEGKKSHGRQGAGLILFGTSEPVSEPIMLDQVAEEGYGIEIEGAEQGYNTGNAVGRAGDINLDGYDDILISASDAYGPRNNSADDWSGLTYLILGGDNFDDNRIRLAESFEGVTMLGIHGSRMGDALGNTGNNGDFDSDMLPDILIGIPDFDRCLPDSEDPYRNTGAVASIAGWRLQEAYSDDGIIDLLDLFPHLDNDGILLCNTKPGLDWIR